MQVLKAMVRSFLYDYNARKYVAKQFPGTMLERNVFIKGDLKNLKLGKGVIIQSGTVLHLGGMPWCEDKGSLVIGDNACISPNCVIYGGGPGGVEIGKNFECGANVGIFSSFVDYTSDPLVHIFAPVKIGDNVIICSNCVISLGVTIGDGAVIAAGSVVIRDIPENCFAAGSPAKVLKTNVR